MTASYEKISVHEELTVWGMWSSKTSDLKTAVFSSVKAPGAVILEAHELAKRWRKQSITLISGFQSPVEEEFWDVIWPIITSYGTTKRVPADGPILVKVLARGMVKRLSPEHRVAIENGRLVLLSPFPDTIRRASKRLAVQRNRVAAALAEKVFIAHAEPGSSTFALAQEVLGWGKPVYTLDHPANKALLELGARLFKEVSEDLPDPGGE